MRKSGNGPNNSSDYASIGEQNNNSRPGTLKTNQSKLREMMNGSLVNGQEDMNYLRKQSAEYRLLYITLGAYAILSSLMSYPSQMWLKSKGMDKDTVKEIRLGFFVPWLLKPFMAALGDLVFMFKYKIRGWVILLGLGNFLATTLAVAFGFDIIPMLIVIFGYLFSMAFLDTIAQGITAMVVELERRRFSIKYPIIPLGSKFGPASALLQPVRSARSGQPRTNEISAGGTPYIKKYIPTYAYNYGMYCCVSTFARAVYITFAYSEYSENHFSPTLLLVVAGASLITVIVSLSTNEFQQSGWVRSPASQREGVDSFLEAIKTWTQNGRWMLSLSVTLVLAAICMNPINYLNETLVSTTLDKDGTRLHPGSALLQEGDISFCTAIGGTLASIMFFIVFNSFKKIGLGFYLFWPLVLLYINSGMAFYFDKEYKFDSMYALYTYITYSHFVQSSVCTLCRLSMVDLFMRYLEGDSFHLILVNILTTLGNWGAVGAKFLQARQYSEDKVDGDCYRAGMEGMIWCTSTLIFGALVYFYNRLRQKEE